MEFNWLRALVLTILIGSDAGLAVYQRYFTDRTDKASLPRSPPPNPLLPGLVCLTHRRLRGRRPPRDRPPPKLPQASMGEVPVVGVAGGRRPLLGHLPLPHLRPQSPPQLILPTYPPPPFICHTHDTPFPAKNHNLNEDILFLQAVVGIQGFFHFKV